MSKAQRIIDMLLEMPVRKISYLSVNRTLVSALWETLERYGLEHTPKLLALMKDRIGVHLEESEDIDHEWSEESWEATMCFNPFNKNN